MTRRRRQRPTSATARAAAAVLVLAVAVFAAAPAGAHAADRYRRAFNWSGYHWIVRSTTKRAGPGHNLWGDARANVHVRADKALVLGIAHGRSVDIVGPRTGYGTYRWVVDSDLSTADPFRVAAFFVYGTGGELDMEFSRWGYTDLAAPGTWVVWRGLARQGFSSFAVTPVRPYTLEIDWMVGATRFTMHDGTGAALLDTTVPSGSGGRHVAPHVSYWRYPGRGAARAPFTASTIHPPVVVRSFQYTPRVG